ncbi:MAG: SCP2 sterol-binding domain-containing protein, partial [Saprospiraceae bacterium]|nr:SCP2 sterol-binding domain-containing protein [Saprospiraceae bacterium]
TDFFDKMLSKVDPENLIGIDTLLHFEIEGENAGQYTIEIKDGKVDLKQGLLGEAVCSVKSTEKNLKALANGELNPMMAVMTGKVKISNPMELLKYAKILGLM